MKKWILGLVLAAFCLSLGACVKSASPQPTSEPAITNAPTETPTDPPEDPVSGPCVRVMNTNLRQQQAWEAIAEEFEQVTGVDVRIVSNMDSATLRTISSGADLPESCMDLSASTACAQLINWDLTLRDDQGQVLAVANEIEIYGLMYHSGLLAQTAHTREDITNFAQLTEVVYTISDNAETLGFSAFAKIDPDEHFAIQLASLTGNPRNLVELILNNATLDPDNRVNAIRDFRDGNAVFLLTGSRDQEALSTIGTENIGVLPIYLGTENEENQTLCVAPRSYWCINGAADPEDQAATLDFLDYLTTPRADGTLPVDDLKQITPFRQAGYVSGIFDQILRLDVAQGKVPVVCRYVAQAPEGLTDALLYYARDPSDNNWEVIMNIVNNHATR